MKKNEQLPFGKVMDLEKSAFVIDQHRFEDNLVQMYSAFNSFYPNVKIAYSYKTNYIPHVCKIAHQNSCWAEVVSEMEVDMALHFLEDKSNIIYNGPIKSLESIQKVILNGGIINLDSFQDLEYVEKVVENVEDRKVKLAIRLNSSFQGIDSRFGLDFNSIGILRKRVYDNPKLDLIGYHLHLPFRSLDSYKARINALIEVIKSHGSNPLKYINIGGGFFGRISSDLANSLNLKDTPIYSDYGRLIGEELSSYFKKENFQNWPELFIEPGSSVIADAMWFLTRIHTSKKINNNNLLVTYAGRHLLSPTNKEVRLPSYLFRCSDKEALEEDFLTQYKVVGYTCIESDILGEINSKDVIDQDHFIAISNVGSYSIVMGSDFILPQPPIYLMYGGEIKLVRKSRTVYEIINSFVQ